MATGLVAALLLHHSNVVSPPQPSAFPHAMASRPVSRLPDPGWVELDSDNDPNQAAIAWARRLPDSEMAAEDGAFVRFGSTRVRRDLVQTVLNAAAATDSDPALLMAIADKESNFSPSIQARSSSATGLFQFIDRTWFKVVRAFGDKHGLAREASLVEGPDDRPYVTDPAERARILALRNDPYLASLFAAEMLKHDSAKIGEHIGRDLTEGETYLTHFLGAADAERFLAKMSEAPDYAAAKLLPAPARANPPIFFQGSMRKAGGLSIAAVHDKFEEMMGLRTDRYRDVDKIPGLSAYAEP